VIVSISEKICCVPQTLHVWVKKAEVGGDKQTGVPMGMADRLKVLEQEVR